MWLEEQGSRGARGGAPPTLTTIRPGRPWSGSTFGQRTCSEVVAALDWFEVSGDGNRLVVRDGDELLVVSAERK